MRTLSNLKKITFAGGNMKKVFVLFVAAVFAVGYAAKPNSNKVTGKKVIKQVAGLMSVDFKQRKASLLQLRTNPVEPELGKTANELCLTQMTLKKLLQAWDTHGIDALKNQALQEVESCKLNISSSSSQPPNPTVLRSQGAVSPTH